MDEGALGTWKASGCFTTHAVQLVFEKKPVHAPGQYEDTLMLPVA